MRACGSALWDLFGATSDLVRTAYHDVVCKYPSWRSASTNFQFPSDTLLFCDHKLSTDSTYLVSLSLSAAAVVPQP